MVSACKYPTRALSPIENVILCALFSLSVLAYHTKKAWPPPALHEGAGRDPHALALLRARVRAA
eukprot:1044922-Pleurochrysis_carterae.AAC.1